MRDGQDPITITVVDFVAKSCTYFSPQQYGFPCKYMLITIYEIDLLGDNLSLWLNKQVDRRYYIKSDVQIPEKVSTALMLVDDL